MSVQQTTHNEEDPIIVQKYTLPMIVPDVGETDAQFSARWERFRSLPEDVKDILASEKSMNVVQHIGKRMGFDLSQMAFLARAVRMYYFGELPLEGLADYFVQNIGVAPMTAQKIAQILVAQIIKKTVKDTKERMTLREALDRFAEIKDQVITEGYLTVAGAQRQQAGTIENWLTDYHLAIGQGRHSVIERGNYLFHNRNTKPLSAVDRQRVAMVLKSFDEDMKMVVDVTRKQIVFPLAQKIPQRSGVQKPSSPMQQKASLAQHASQQHTVQKGAIIKKRQAEPRRNRVAQPMGYVNFSSGQRLSQERNRTE